MNCSQNPIDLCSQKKGVLQFNGDFLVVDGNQVPYASQMLTNQMLYITDLALEIQNNQQIDQFDQKYFLESINSQIVGQIQAVHSSIGIQILKQMANLGTKTYSAIFLKLSISKIKYILMDDAFYIYLCATCKKLINGNLVEDNSDATQFERNLLNCLETPQKRILYLLDSLRKNQVELRPAIEQTAQQLIFKILGQTKFIQSLGYSKNKLDQNESQMQSNTEVINSEFLTSLCKIVKTLQSLATSPKQIKEVYQFSNSSIFSQLLFTKQCLSMIGKHFQYFFLYDRKRLMLILSLLSIHSNKQLWFEIISRKNKTGHSLKSKSLQQGQIVSTQQCYNQQDTKKQQQNINNKKDNINLFTQLILSNFFDFQSQAWDMTVFILLQLIQANIKESRDMLSHIFMQIIQNRLNFDDIALISRFFTIQMQNLQYQQDQYLKSLTYTLFTNIGIQINSLFNQYRLKHSKRFPESKVFNIISFSGCQRLMFPKINSLKICAFLRVFIVFFQRRLIKWSINVPYVLLIEKLLIMTKGRGGIVSGVRKILLKQIECYIKQRQSEQQKSTEVKKSVLTSRIKSFKISIPKQNPNSIDKLKKLLRI